MTNNVSQAIEAFIQDMKTAQTNDQIIYHVSKCGLCKKWAMAIIHHTEKKLEKDGV